MRNNKKLLGLSFLLCLLVASCSIRIRRKNNSNSAYQETSSFSGQSVEKQLTVNQEYSLFAGIQDGCVYDDTLFAFDSYGVCRIYDLTDFSLVCTSALQAYDGIFPHSNCVCFGEKFDQNDRFPLLYTNIYNNSPDNRSFDGVCCVYRITQDNEVYSFALLQVLHIAFADDLSVWYNNSLNESPFGNFLVNDQKLIVYLNVFGSEITRFFVFELPNVNFYMQEVEEVSLTIEEIVETFDLALFSYIQGATFFENYLLSLEGSGNEQYPGFLRIVDMQERAIQSINLNEVIGFEEPELLAIYGDSVLIGTFFGKLYFCSLFS